MAGEALSLSETVYGTGAETAGAASSMSMFSSMLGYVGLAYGLYSMISSGFAAAEQKREQTKLAKKQGEQARLLWQKMKADNESLYSTAMSSVAQKSAPMGAVY